MRDAVASAPSQAPENEATKVPGADSEKRTSPGWTSGSLSGS